MFVYLIDVENVGRESFLKYIKNKDDAQFIYFMNINCKHEFTTKNNKIIQLETNAVKNACDFLLISRLGYLLRENPYNTYIIVSNDKGYELTIDYWKHLGFNVSQLSPNNENSILNYKILSDYKIGEVGLILSKFPSSDKTLLALKGARLLSGIKDYPKILKGWGYNTNKLSNYLVYPLQENIYSSISVDCKKKINTKLLLWNGKKKLDLIIDLLSIPNIQINDKVLLDIVNKFIKHYKIQGVV